uniref:Uncharacterized protein n=2 Tax=Spongospora subterranea TaxID=70186 RepID=A0A0H5QLC2_9EUKA|eukprot:CRZ02407.1 hypothetical protein [Spongospora subterranea]
MVFGHRRISTLPTTSRFVQKVSDASSVGWQDVTFDTDPFCAISSDSNAISCLNATHAQLCAVRDLRDQRSLALFFDIDDQNSSHHINESLALIERLLADGLISSFGFRSQTAFEHASLPDLLVAVGHDLRPKLAAIRAPFNLFEQSLFRNGSIETAKSHGLLVVAERVLMMGSRTGQKTFTLVNTLSPHTDLDLIRALKQAFNNVIHLETRAQKAGMVLPWARRIAGAASGQLMSSYTWKVALQRKILPGLQESLDLVRAKPDQHIWADQYEEAFQTLIERMTLAVEQAAHNEMVAIANELTSAGVESSLPIEERVSQILISAGVDITFSPGAQLSSTPTVSLGVARSVLDHFSSARLYFEEPLSSLPCNISDQVRPS